MYPKTDPNEKAQIEEVFGLTGGELEDKPLRFLGDTRWHDGEPRGEPRRWWARFWYTGSPDYASEISRRWTAITIVYDETFVTLPDRIQAQGKRWRKVRSYSSSGEVECPATWDPQDGECPLCETNHSNRSFIYIGDGWTETIYITR